MNNTQFQYPQNNDVISSLARKPPNSYVESSRDQNEMTHSVSTFPSDNLVEGARLYCNVFNEPPWDDDWTIEIARNRLSEITETPGYHGYGVSHDDELVGVALGNLEQWYSGQHFYLKEMCILPTRQQQGIGTKLFQFLVNDLQSEGTERIYLLTKQESPACRFYAANGFQHEERMRMQFLELDS